MKVCFDCFGKACAYQPPEITLRFVALYPEHTTKQEQECDFHSKEQNTEILAWVFDALDYGKEPR